MGEYSAELMAGALQGNPTSYDTDKFTFVSVRAAMRAVRAGGGVAQTGGRPLVAGARGRAAAPAAADADPGASAGAAAGGDAAAHVAARAAALGAAHHGPAYKERFKATGYPKVLNHEVLCGFTCTLHHLQGTRAAGTTAHAPRSWARARASAGYCFVSPTTGT